MISLSLPTCTAISSLAQLAVTMGTHRSNAVINACNLSIYRLSKAYRTPSISLSIFSTIILLVSRSVLFNRRSQSSNAVKSSGEDNQYTLSATVLLPYLQSLVPSQLFRVEGRAHERVVGKFDRGR